AVRVVVDQLHAFLIAVHANHSQHRPEDLVGVDAHVGSHMIEERGPDKEAFTIGIDFWLASIYHQRCASRLAGVDITRHTLLGLCGHEWPHVAAPGAVTGPQPDGPLLDLGHQLVSNVADCQHGGDRHTALACRAVAGVHGLVGCKIEIGVRQHQLVVLGTAESLHTLTVSGSGLIDVPGNWGRSDKGD